MKSFSYYLDKIGEVGFVETITKAIVWVTGLPGVKPNEVVIFESGQLGQALFLYPEKIEVLLLSDSLVKPGTRVVRTGEKLAVPVGSRLLGRVIDGLGRPIDRLSGYIAPKVSRVLSKDSPGIKERASVHRHLETGVPISDVLVPLGYGQRELIIGDRKTGKSTFLLQTVLTQAKMGMICIYAVLGKKRSEAKQIEEFFIHQKVMDQIIMIVASAQEAIGLIYLAPYTALALAEHFRDEGKDSLVILDDMSVHAKFYREIALLSQRFPGRDSYPTDIFFTHAGLLEKGGNFRTLSKTDKGEASITILPVAETNSGDLSGYIQTNLMSMTDGHLYFDREMFSAGRRPAINPFLSVTRVGRQTQTALLREFSRKLMSFLTYLDKLQNYVHFGAELTEEVRSNLAKGERINYFFNQAATELIPLNMAIYIIACLWLSYWPELKNSELKAEWTKLIKKYQEEPVFRKKMIVLIEKATNLDSLLESIK